MCVSSNIFVQSVLGAKSNNNNAEIVCSEHVPAFIAMCLSLSRNSQPRDFIKHAQDSFRLLHKYSTHMQHHLVTAFCLVCPHWSYFLLPRTEMLPYPDVPGIDSTKEQLPQQSCQLKLVILCLYWLHQLVVLTHPPALFRVSVFNSHYKHLHNMGNAAFLI